MKVPKLLSIFTLLVPLFLGCGKQPEFEGKPLSHWRAQAKDTSPEFRTKAASALGHLGDVTTLVDLLGDPVPNVRSAAVAALEQIGEAANPAVDKALRTSSDSNVRTAALMIVARKGLPAVPTLSDFAHDDDACVQAAAIAGLGRVAGCTWSGSADDNAAVRALVEIGPPAVQTLTELILNKVSHGSSAVDALGKMGPAAIPTLTELAKESESLFVRSDAVKALRKMGPPAIPALTELVKDKDTGVRDEAIEALGKMGPAAIPTLTELAKDKDPIVRFEAIEALGKMGPPAIPTLMELTKDNGGNVRRLAGQAIGQMGPAAKDAIPVLMNLAKDDDKHVRSAAAWAIGQMGPTAKDAIPVLTKLAKDDDSHVRSAAEEALAKIRHGTRQ